MKQDAPHPTHSCKCLPSGNLQGGEDVTAPSSQNNIYQHALLPCMVLEYSYKHRLRQKEISLIANELNARLGTVVFSGTDNVESASLRGFGAMEQYDILFVDNELVGIISGKTPMLTVRGLLRYTATKKHVTVDMGAVPHICNGADVMTPGIADADPGIAAGDFVWMRDEKNRKPLAIGESLMPGEGLRSSEKGKGVRMIHHVGDELWGVGGKQ